jgi:hypothetical protein
MCTDDEGLCMKRVVKFFLDSSLDLEELDSPPLVHSRTAIVASCLGLLSLTTFFLGLSSILVKIDVLMMTPFSQVDVVAVHVDFLHIFEDLLHVLGHHGFNLFIT